MARFAPFVLVSLILAAPTQAQVAPGNATSPWQVSEERKPQRSFNLTDISSGASTSAEKGSQIVAGTELYPNTTFGVGMFGEKTDRPAHAPATNRDYTIPSTRKAAVGVALRF